MFNIFPPFKDMQGNQPVRVLGIDLGTTNSVVAEIKWDPGNPDEIKAECIEIEQETLEGCYTHWLVPSVVTINGDKLYIGEGAKRQRADFKKYGLKPKQNLFHEFKNDMGIKLTYATPLPGFKTAREIGGKVLDFLLKSALKHDPTFPSRVVVTVPASFQAAQREDTLDAARRAGMEIKGGDLLDEPVAAFLDFLVGYADSPLVSPGESKNIVIFDFGGGTCDVAVFNFSLPLKGDGFRVASHSVSRYHRLGGGDIDRVIIYNVLIPQLMEQNGLSAFDLGYREKKVFLEPSLLGVAESLKIKMSREIDRLKKFRRYDVENKEQIVTKYPGVFPCSTDGQDYMLESPSLTARQFEDVLASFLDRDLLYARENEYHMTCSIFAPLQDALDRSNLKPEEIDYCLLVGGSSMIPQVKEAVASFFPSAQLLFYPELNDSQTAAARGAAYHALGLELLGGSLVRPVCHDRICIRTQSGPVELIPKGVELPFPSVGSAVNQSLAVPETGNHVEIRIDLVAGSDERILFSKIWRVGNALEGEPISVEYSYDENQVLTVLISLTNHKKLEIFEEKLERPLTNVVNPNATKELILEIEEEIRSGQLSQNELLKKMMKVAKLHAELKQYEKAIDILKGALMVNKGPDSVILNLMGIYCGYLGDEQRQEKFYREAAAVGDWDGPLFNLALALSARKKIDEAIAVIDEAIKKYKNGPSLVLKAKLEWRRGNLLEGNKYLEEAFALFDPVEHLDNWELSWYLTGANMLKDRNLINKAKAEEQARQGAVKAMDGILPEIIAKEAD